MRDHGGGGRQGDPGAISNAIQKATEKGVIVPPPNEIIETHTMEKLPINNTSNENEELLFAGATISPEMAKAARDTLKKAEYDSDVEKLRKSLEAKRAREAGVVESSSTENTANVANTEASAPSPTAATSEEFEGYPITAPEIKATENEAGEFQGHPITAPSMESSTNEAVVTQPNSTETGTTKKTPEEIRNEATLAQEAAEAKAQGKLAKIGTMMLERAAPLGKKALEATRHVGTKYQKLPFKTKMLITGSLLVGSLGSAAFGMGGATLAFSTAATLQRAFAGAATFTSTEALLYRAAQSIGGKDGAKREIGTKEGLAYLTTAMIAGLVVGVGIGNIGDTLEKAREVPGAVGGAAGNAKDYVVEKVGGLWGAESATQEAVATTNPEAPQNINFTAPQEAAPAPTPTISPEVTIKSGDTLWKALGSKLEESGRLEGLSEAQKTYVVDSIKDKLEAMQSMSPDKIKALGISSGDINALKVGETLNLSSILGDKELIEKAVSNAGDLTPDQITNIQEGGVAAAPSIPPEAGSFTGGAEIPPQAGDFTGETTGTLEATTDKNPYGWGPWEDPNDTTRTPEAIERAATINAAAETSVKSDINELFGKKGFLGIGKVEGLNSPHMVNSFGTGFADMSPDTILNSPTPSTYGNEPSVGFANPEAHQKMIGYLKEIQNETGVKPTSNETTLEYIKRAARIQVERSMLNK